MRYVQLYRKYLAMAIKAKLSYRVDLIIGIFSFVLSNAINFMTMFLIFSAVPNIQGWTIDQMVFLYAFSLIPKGIDHVFTDAIWFVGHRFVVMGEIDKYLVRPINPLFQIIASEFQYEGFGEVFLGIAVFALVLPSQQIVWGWHNTIPFVLCGFTAIFVFTGVKLMTATVAFFTKRSIQLMSTLYELSNFARYPVEIFGSTMKQLLLFVVPFGLVIYYPVKYLYEGKSLWGLWGVILLVTIAWNVVAYRFWVFGLSKYESTGT